MLFTYGHSCIHLLQQIDANVAKHLSQPWKATLPVNGLLCSRQYSAPPLGDDFIPLDLFHYTDPTWKGYHVRFDTHEFPVVPGGLTSNKEGRKKLVKHLSTISHLRGSCQLISNGGGKSRYAVTATESFDICRRRRLAILLCSIVKANKIATTYLNDHFQTFSGSRPWKILEIPYPYPWNARIVWISLYYSTRGTVVP